MARDTGLGDPEDRGQLGHVQALGVKHAEQPEPEFVSKQPEQSRCVVHIY